MWNFTIVSTVDYNQWLDLYKKADTHVFNHPRLLTAWLNTFFQHNHVEPLYIWGESDDGNISLWPFVIWHRNWKNAFIRQLMPMGGSDYDYHSPLFAQPADFEKYASELLPWIRKNLRYDLLNISGIPDSLLSTKDSRWERGEICPRLNLEGFNGDCAQLLPAMKTSLRGDLRRQARRIQEALGALELVALTDHTSAMQEYDEFMDSHRKRWPNAYKTPGFHKALLTDEMLAGPVRFSVLRAGDKSVAWHLGFADDRTYYYYMPSGNPDYMQYSPTKLHLQYLIESAIASGLNVFDHLRGDETYKSGWSNDAQYVNSYIQWSDKSFSVIKRGLYGLRKLFR